MIVLDPGHEYLLDEIDADHDFGQPLIFVIYHDHEPVEHEQPCTCYICRGEA